MEESVNGPGESSVAEMIQEVPPETLRIGEVLASPLLGTGNSEIRILEETRRGEPKTGIRSYRASALTSDVSRRASCLVWKGKRHLKAGSS